MITRKSPAQVELMRRAGRVVAEMHSACTEAAKPGVTTGELDQVARDVLDRSGAQSNFLNYHGYPAVICTSPNNVIVHGIPGSY
ncbi:MAG: M24 family metallopeptidase, partial [Acidimicrobiia bacterium]